MWFLVCLLVRAKTRLQLFNRVCHTQIKKHAEKWKNGLKGPAQANKRLLVKERSNPDIVLLHTRPQLNNYCYCWDLEDILFGSFLRFTWWEDEMVGWHHWLNGHEYEQTLGDGEGQGSLECCSPWGCKELDTDQHLNNNNLSYLRLKKKFYSKFHQNFPLIWNILVKYINIKYFYINGTIPSISVLFEG